MHHINDTDECYFTARIEKKGLKVEQKIVEYCSLAHMSYYVHH